MLSDLIKAWKNWKIAVSINNANHQCKVYRKDQTPSGSWKHNHSSSCRSGAIKHYFKKIQKTSCQQFLSSGQLCNPAEVTQCITTIIMNF